MPSSAVRTFTDPDDYAALIRSTKAELTVTARGEFTAQLISIDLHRLWMQRFSDNLPRVGHSAGGRGRVIISFRSLPGPSLLWGDEEMQLTNIVRHAEGESTFQRSSGSASWGAMSLPVADAVATGDTFGGCDLAPPKTALIVRPRPSALARLHRLHAAAGDLAKKAPEIIANPDAARGLEQALIEAMVACLGYPETRKSSLAQRAARDGHASFSARGGGEPGAAALHSRDLQGNKRSKPDVADVLPGASGDGAKALPGAAPPASGPSGIARGSV